MNFTVNEYSISLIRDSHLKISPLLPGVARYVLQHGSDCCMNRGEISISETLIFRSLSSSVN
jgi:hypothetical protein